MHKLIQNLQKTMPPKWQWSLLSAKDYHSDELKHLLCRWCQQLGLLPRWRLKQKTLLWRYCFQKVVGRWIGSDGYLWVWGVRRQNTKANERGWATSAFTNLSVWLFIMLLYHTKFKYVVTSLLIMLYDVLRYIIVGLTLEWITLIKILCHLMQRGVCGLYSWLTYSFFFFFFFVFLAFFGPLPRLSGFLMVGGDMKC